MRILMVSRLWPPSVVGGAERYAAGLAEQLEAQGHVVGVVTYGVEADRVVVAVPTHGVDPTRWWTASPLARRRSHVLDLWNAEAARAVRDATRSFQPDVVHSHAVAGLSVAALLAPGPRVHTVHDHWLLCWRGSPMRGGEPCESTCLRCVPYATSRRTLVQRRPPLFLAPSEAVRRAHLDRGWPAAGWRVIRQPVTPPARPPAPRSLPSGPLRLGFIGQLSRDKGIDLVLDALDALPNGTRLVVAGEGHLADRVADHPAAEHQGFVSGEAKERFFADIDVLVVPSRVEEVAPLVMDEASSRGVPIIGARRGGIPEYVPPGCQDLVFDPAAPQSLIDAVRRFAADPAAYPAAPPAGRSWTDHTAQVLAAYADAIDGGRS